MRKFNRIFVRGDVHADFDFLPYFCQEKQTSINDLLIILGDAGINYHGSQSWRDRHLKQLIAREPITLLCIRGNHEARPADYYGYKLVDVGIAADVYMDENYPNIWFAQDGGVYNLNGKICLAIGGAYSIDKEYRLLMGYGWFPNEMLDVDERMAILDDVYGRDFDHVFTHTCPIEWEPTDLFLPGFDQSKVRKDMEYFLSDVNRYITYGNWWFGHYHADRMIVAGNHNVHMLYNSIEEIC